MGASKRAAKIQAIKPAPKEDEGASNGKQRAGLHRQLVKTKFCMYHLKGTCQYGSACSFAHSNSELQSTPDLWKTRLCKAYAEGGCTDPDCSFAHGEGELRSTDIFFKKTLCIWHQKGKCRDGDRCRYAHGISELRLQTQAQMSCNTDDKDSHGLTPKLAQAEINAAGVQSCDASLEPMKIVPLSSLDSSSYIEHQPSTPPGLMPVPPGLTPAPPGLLHLPKGLDQIQPQAYIGPEVSNSLSHIGEASLAQSLLDYHDPTSVHNVLTLLKAQLEGTAAWFPDQSQEVETPAAAVKSQYSDLCARSHMLDEMLFTFEKDKSYAIFNEQIPMPENWWKPDEMDAFGMHAPCQDYLNLSDQNIWQGLL